VSKLTDCDPVTSYGDSKKVEDIYYPCGLIAKSMFNGRTHISPLFFKQNIISDTFTMFHTDSGAEVSLRKNGISWYSDRHWMFKKTDKKQPGIYVVPDVTDEDFIVWMRTAALSKFRKLYRIYDGPEDLSGKLTVKIQNSILTFLQLI